MELLLSWNDLRVYFVSYTHKIINQSTITEIQIHDERYNTKLVSFMIHELEESVNLKLCQSTVIP
jgi:hypothetical protein